MSHLLPPSWGTLYELSRLEPLQLEKAIADGEVTPTLERKAAKALVARYRIEAEPEVGDDTPSPQEVPEGLVSTIVADPPWRYGNTSTRAAAEDHYPTMSIDELCDLPVADDRAAEDAHLYMWTTAGHLPEAFRVMEAWGFEYKTFLVWVKPQMGMGNYFRVSAELVLFGVRGKLAIEDRGIKNWFEAKRGKHSAKPESFYELVRQASPGPYLETQDGGAVPDPLAGGLDLADLPDEGAVDLFHLRCELVDGGHTGGCAAGSAGARLSLFAVARLPLMASARPRLRRHRRCPPRPGCCAATART